MVDTSNVDILALIERKAGIRTVGKLSRVRGVLEIHSNCPWCPGTENSFIVRPEEGTYSHAIRQGTGHGCGRHGDAINFLYEWEGTGFLDACEELGIPLDGESSGETVTYRRYKPEFAPQTRKWRDTADAKLSRAQALIHQGIGLEYARGRGLTDGTILDWRLGYVPFRDSGQQRFFTLDADEWGIDHEKRYFMYEGLLIPWMVKGKVWKLQVRRISGNIDPHFKILPIKGSVDHCLFNQDAITPDKPVVLVESAICAISGNQEAGHLATFVATGGTTSNRYEHNVALLACAPLVLIAFDDDRNQAGDGGAKYWVDALPNAHRWLPWAKDINAMLVEGKNIRAWVETGFMSALLEEEDETKEVAPVAIETHLDHLVPLPNPDAPDRVEREEATPDQDDTIHEVSTTISLSEVGSATQEEMPEHEAYDDPLNFCAVCGAVVDEIVEDETGRLVGYCKGHKPMTRDEIIERFKDAFPGWKVELLPSGVEYPPKQQIRVQTPVQSQQDDFWTEIAQRRAAFDPSKPVDWTKHGYQRGQDGRWHVASSDYWKDAGYRKVRGHWELPEGKR